MLQSPLKKNKHSYPIDFYNRRKEPIRKQQQKYDMVFAQQNPQNNSNLKGSFVSQDKSLNSQLFIETGNKYLNKGIDKQVQSKQTAHSYEKELKQKFTQAIIFNHSSKSQQNEQPLKQVRKRLNHVIMDENLLKNPRIQFNEQKTIKTSERTLQTLSPQIMQKQKKQSQIGGIKHQDLKFYEQYENQKQIPLLPEKPFDSMNKNLKRNSLLEKINIGKMKYSEIQQKHYDSYVNNQIRSGNKVFRPQTYTYANCLIPSQKQKNVKRANSSFDVHKRQKIIYLNSDNRNNFSFNLPDLSSNNSQNKFRKPNSLVQNELNLKSKFSARQNVGKFFSTRKNFSHQVKEDNGEIPNFQHQQLSKLKHQINVLAQNRFRNRLDQNQKQRHFTFQDDQKTANQQIKKQKIKQKIESIKKNTKKLQITYHVPLSNLKTLCRKYLSNPEEYSMAFKVPKIFMESRLFSKSQQKDQLHQNALILFESLKISSKDLAIKRYSNCIMFITGHIVVIWYFNGKRYLGGWQYEYLDEGSRHGLGLEWQPNNHIYYGQFRKNKKHGLGAMKVGPQQVTIGYWSNGKHIGTVFKQQNQAIESEDQQSQNNQRINQPQFNNNFRDFNQGKQYRG